MNKFFWIVLWIAGMAPCITRAQSNMNVLEKRMERWRPLIQTGEAENVLDSCTAIIPTLVKGRQFRLHALALSLQASATTQLGRPDLALALHRSALSLRRHALGERHLETANSYQNIGNCLLALGNTQEAGMMFKKAVSIKEGIFAEASPELIRIYNSIGQYYQGEQNYERAHYYLDRALSISERCFGAQSLRIIPRLLELADLYTAENNDNEALQLLRRAYDIQIDSLWEDRSTRIKLLNNLGNAYSANGDYAEALSHLHAALQYREQLAENEGVSRAIILANIGNVMLNQGDFAAAEAVLQSALSEGETAGEKRADVLNSLGLAMRYRGKREAIDTFIVAANLYLRAGFHPKLRQTVAGVWMNVGNIHLDRNEYEPAIYYFKKALDHLWQVPGSNAARAACLDKIGLCKLSLKDFGSALAIWQQLLKERQNLPITIVYAILYHRGSLYTQQQNWAAAAADYQEAISLLAGNGPLLYSAFPYEQIQSLTALAGMWQAKSQQSDKNSDWEQAAYWATQAVTALQRLKKQIRAGRSAIELQQIFDTPFDIAVTAHLALGRPEQAWYYSELFKSNFLQKLRWQSALHSDFRLPADWVKNEIAWNNALLYYQRLQDESTLLPDIRKKVFADSIQHIFERLYHLRKKISEQFPETYHYLYEPELPSLSSVRQLLEKDQCLLIYHWRAADNICAFVIRRDTFIAQTLSVKEHFANDVLNFFQYCSYNPYRLPDSSRSAHCDELIALGQLLYRQLAAPLESLLTKQVLLVPDATLCVLPFEALVSQKGTSSYRMDQHHYWMQDHTISYNHSTASWVAMKSRKLDSNKQGLLVVAPDFQHSTKGLSPLQFNQSEASAICEATEATAILGVTARKAVFLKQADQYASIHLATHGVVNDREPLASYIAFTEQPGDSVGSNLLYVSDIYSSSFSTELIVLSACQTASGQLYRGEGMISIAQAFQFAGAQSLIASLWNVDDQRTPALMESFYKNLGKSMPKNEALNRSKRGYIDSHRGLDAHPCFWAGLQLSGSENAVAQTSPWLVWWLVLALVIVSGTLGYFKGMFSNRR